MLSKIKKRNYDSFVFLQFYRLRKNTEVLFFRKSCILKIKTYLCTRNTEVAQSVEHWSPKPGVGSSSLSFRAKAIQIVSLFFVFQLFLTASTIRFPYIIPVCQACQHKVNGALNP